MFNRQLMKTMVCGLILILYTALFAGFSPKQYGFYSLLSSSDMIATGKVNKVEKTKNKFQMSFKIQKMLEGESNNKQLTINTKLHNGFYIPDKVYLEKGKKYLLFLKEENGEWKVANGKAGVFNVKENKGVRKVLKVYNNKGFNSNHIKNLFFSCESKEIKKRLLNDLEENISKKDVSFLKKLLESDNKRYQVFSIQEIGQLKVKGMRKKIESILQNSEDQEIKFYCINALGNIGNSKSRELIIPYLSYTNQGIRRVAIEALGKIKGKQIIAPLKEMYSKEDDFGNRIAIINAIENISDKKVVKKALKYFKNVETKSLNHSIIKRKIKEISNK